MATRNATFEAQRETDNTVVFKETPESGTAPMVGRLYVQKWALHQMGNPARITVTVTAQ